MSFHTSQELLGKSKALAHKEAEEAVQAAAAAAAAEAEAVAEAAAAAAEVAAAEAMAAAAAKCVGCACEGGRKSPHRRWRQETRGREGARQERNEGGRKERKKERSGGSKEEGKEEGGGRKRGVEENRANPALLGTYIIQALHKVVSASAQYIYDRERYTYVAHADVASYDRKIWNEASINMVRWPYT